MNSCDLLTTLIVSCPNGMNSKVHESCLWWIMQTATQSFCEKFQNRYPADCNPNLRICLCRQIGGFLCPKSIKKATSLEIIYSLMMMSQGSHANHRLWLMKIHTTSDQNMPGKSQRNNHASFCVVFILL